MTTNESHMVNPTSASVATRCKDTPLLRLTPIQWYLAYTCVAISATCLALFVVERLCRNGRFVWLYPGRIAHALAWTLLLAHVIFLVGAGRNEIAGVCSGVAASLHFSLLSTFFWLNAMCIDIFRCFFFVTYRPMAGQLFLRSAIYAWGIPILFTILAVCLDEFLQDDELHAILSTAKPCFGYGGICWFGSPGGFGILFVLPASLLLLVDGLAFAAIVFWMRDTRADAVLQLQEPSAVISIASTREPRSRRRAKSLNPASFRRRRSSSVNIREHHRFKIYIRLSIVLTLPWACGIVGAIGDFPFLWYASALLMGFQGSFIFVAFGAKRRLIQLLWKKATGKPLRKRTTVKDTSNKQETKVMCTSTSPACQAPTAIIATTNVIENPIEMTTIVMKAQVSDAE